MMNYALFNKVVDECTKADLLLWKRLYENKFFTSDSIVKGDTLSDFFRRSVVVSQRHNGSCSVNVVSQQPKVSLPPVVPRLSSCFSPERPTLTLNTVDHHVSLPLSSSLALSVQRQRERGHEQAAVMGLSLPSAEIQRGSHHSALLTSSRTALQQDEHTASEWNLRSRRATNAVKVKVTQTPTPTIVVQAPFALPRGKQASFRFRRPLAGNKYARVTLTVDPNNPPSQHECRLHPNFDYTFVASAGNQLEAAASACGVSRTTSSRGTRVTLEKYSDNNDVICGGEEFPSADGSSSGDYKASREEKSSVGSDTIPPCLPPLLTYVPVSVTNLNYPPIPEDEDDE